MEHPIKFSTITKQVLSYQLNDLIDRIPFKHYGNEPNYIPALVQALSQFTYKDHNLEVKFEGAVMTSVGRNSTEKWSGSDLSLVVTISRNSEKLRKGVLLQSKIGKVETLSKRELTRLKEQIHKMTNISRPPNSPKILEISPNSENVVTIASAKGVFLGRRFQHISFGDWISKRVIPTFEGNTKPKFVDSLLDANLSRIDMEVTLKF